MAPVPDGRHHRNPPCRIERRYAHFEGADPSNRAPGCGMVLKVAAHRHVPSTDQTSDDGMVDAAHRLVERSTTAAGVPAVVEDPSVYSRVASLVRAVTAEPTGRSTGIAVSSSGAPNRQKSRRPRRTKGNISS